MLFYLFSVAVAHWHPALALCLVAVVTLIWIVPTFGHTPARHPGQAPRNQEHP